MTNYTPAQLEAWAGLGPWEWQKLAEFSSPKYSLGPGVLLTDERDGTPWGDTLDQTNAALIAAAPDLARLVLERDAEIARLKAVIMDARLVAVDAQLRASYQRTALEIISDKLRQAMKETNDE